MNWWQKDLKSHVVHDTILVATDEEELVKPINLLKVASKELGLGVNTSKAKFMVINRARCLPESNFLKEYEKIGRLS